MRKLLFFVAFFLPGILKADSSSFPVAYSHTETAIPDPVNFPINDFSAGMYSYPDANRIPDNAANYIQNFFTDIQPGAIERNGTIQKEATVLGATNAVRGLWTFVDVAGNEWLIAYSSNTFYKETNSGPFAAFGPKTTTKVTPVATNNLGKIWFADGTDQLWWFDGTSTGAVSSAPLGGLVTSWRNRIAVAGSTGTLSTVYFSADGDGTNWTLGGGASDPFSIQVGGANDGYPVNCLYGMYQDTLIVGRKFDLWGMYGFSQADVQTRKLTSEIGCIQNQTMKESDGDLLWMSNRGIERMNGSAIQLISDPIRDLTDLLVKNTGNTSSSLYLKSNVSDDFSAGTTDNASYLVPAPTLNLTFPNTYSPNQTNQIWSLFSPIVGGTITSFVGVQMEVVNGGNQSMGTLGTIINNFQQGTTYGFLLQSMTNNPAAEFHIVISTINSTAGNPVTTTGAMSFGFVSTNTGTAYINDVRQGFTQLKSGTLSPAYILPVYVSVYLSTGNYQVSVSTVADFNGLYAVSPGTVISGTHTAPGGQNYVYFDYLESNNTDSIAKWSNLGVVPETATFTSSIINVGTAITAWGPIQTNDSSSNNGNITYQFGSTNVNNVATVSNFTNINNLQTPGVSVNPYAAFKAYFSVNNTQDTPNLFTFTTQWFEPLFIVSTAWTWDRRYWLSVTTNTFSGSSPDTILVYQRNKTWTLLKGINAASFTRWKDNLYYGDSSGLTGLVYLYDVNYNDNGKPITAILKTKSYDVGFPYRDKSYRKVYAGYQGSFNTAGNFSLNYDIDRSGGSYSLGTASLTEYNGMNEVKFPFNLSTNIPTQGRELQYTLTKSDTLNPLHLYGLNTMYFVKETR